MPGEGSLQPVRPSTTYRAETHNGRQYQLAEKSLGLRFESSGSFMEIADPSCGSEHIHIQIMKDGANDPVATSQESASQLRPSYIRYRNISDSTKRP